MKHPIFVEGQNARVAKTQNPYGRNTEAHDIWEAGFNTPLVNKTKEIIEKLNAWVQANKDDNAQHLAEQSVGFGVKFTDVELAAKEMGLCTEK